MKQRSKLEKVLIDWGAHQLSLSEAAKGVAHEIERRAYHKLPTTLSDPRIMALLCSMLRELARQSKD